MRKLVSGEMMIGEGDTLEEINIDGYAEYTIDKRYGEDADGNRGVMRVDVDDVVEIQAYRLDGSDITLSARDKERAINLLTDKFFEEGI